MYKSFKDWLDERAFSLVFRVIPNHYNFQLELGKREISIHPNSDLGQEENLRRAVLGLGRMYLKDMNPNQSSYSEHCYVAECFLKNEGILSDSGEVDMGNDLVRTIEKHLKQERRNQVEIRNIPIH